LGVYRITKPWFGGLIETVDNVIEIVGEWRVVEQSWIGEISTTRLRDSKRQTGQVVPRIERDEDGSVKIAYSNDKNGMWKILELQIYTEGQQSRKMFSSSHFQRICKC